eukprot:75556_1
MGSITSCFTSTSDEEQALEPFAKHVLAVKDGKEIHQAPPPNIVHAIEKEWPKIAGKTKKITAVYDQLVESAIQWSDHAHQRVAHFAKLDLEFFSWMHETRALRIQHKPVDYDAAFRKYFKNCDLDTHDCLTYATATVCEFYCSHDPKIKKLMKALKKQHDDWALWGKVEEFVVSSMNAFWLIEEFDPKHMAEINKIVSAKKSYYNELLDFDDEDYGSEYQLDEGQGISMGLYNGANRYGVHDKYIGYHNTNGFAYEPTSILLFAGLFLVCCVFLVLLNVISCAGGFVFGRCQSQYPKKNDDDVSINNPI